MVRMRVLGLDPGSRLTGWGVVEGNARQVELLGYGRLLLPRTQGRGFALTRLQEELEGLLARVDPHVAVLETSFTAKYRRASLALAEVRGAALAVLGHWGGPLREYPPARVKAAVVGHGRADKRQVAYVVQHTFHLAAPPPADAADAIALALCYLRLDSLDGDVGGVLASSPAARTQIPDCGRDPKQRQPVGTGGPE